MTTQALTLPPPPVAILARPIDHYVGEARNAMKQSKAARTKAAYASDWRLFVAWCEQHDEIPLPASVDAVLAYISYMVGKPRRISTIERALVSISLAHQAVDLPSPTKTLPVRTALQGFRRQLGVARHKKVPVRKDDLRRIFMTMDEPEHPLAVRDRALLLVGFAGGFRRSELAGFEYEDLEFVDEGLIVNLRRSKTDQLGAGRQVGISRGGALCPVRALQAWLKLANITTGGIFRRVHRSGRISDRAITPAMVAQVVQRHVERIGKKRCEFGGHSLRRGFVSEAARMGATEHAIMKTTGHRSSAMVREYITEATLFQSNASALLGL